MIRNVLISTITFLLLSCSNQVNVEWISSTNDKPWVSKKIIKSQKSDETVAINTQNVLQTIDGFGCCFNELGSKALGMLTKDKSEAIVKSLFSQTDGCKFNVCRMPLGANDYSTSWYSHNETPGDFEMKHFNIDRDKKVLIPYIKRAKNYNPDLKIWASPWCPPSWMKTNNHYACKSDMNVNNLSEDKQGVEMTPQFILQPEYMKAYALYFSKFIDAYKNEGIDIYAVHVQNEPNSCQNFPSCIWTPEALAMFIGEFLGPKLEKTHPKTEIWLGTIERPHFERVSAVLEDESALMYIDGVGFQWAGKGAIPEVHKNYPNMKLMQTETECGNGSNDWPAALHTWALMQHYFNNGANSYMYWNPILDETGKSQWGWKQNSMISVDSKTRKVTINPEFYLMKHLSAYVKKGARYIKSEKNMLCFKNPDQSTVVIYYNADSKKTVKFTIDGQEFTASVDEKSFNTFVLRKV